jgi:hypothetical protein
MLHLDRHFRTEPGQLLHISQSKPCLPVSSSEFKVLTCRKLLPLERASITGHDRCLLIHQFEEHQQDSAANCDIDRRSYRTAFELSPTVNISILDPYADFNTSNGVCHKERIAPEKPPPANTTLYEARVGSGSPSASVTMEYIPTIGVDSGI